MQLSPYRRLTRAEISLPNLAHNVQQIKELIGEKTKIMAMIKANAYGHGAVGIAQALEQLPVDSFGVVCLYEAEELRSAGIKKQVVIMNYIDPDGAKEALALDCELLLMDHSVAKSIDFYARKKGVRARVHVKVDTGMHRSGLLPKDAFRFIQEIEQYPNIRLEGLCTHFADADNNDPTFTMHQIDTFNTLINQLTSKGIFIPHIHAANSAASICFPQLYQPPYTLVRPGIALFGLSSGITINFTMKPVLSLKTIIINIKEIQKDATVGYGRTFTAKRPTNIALLPVGYADGFRRAPSHWPYVLVQGQRAPVIGRISMDQSTIDITDIPQATVGDEVVLIGKQKEEAITAEDVGQWLGTINYEVVSALSARIERTFLP